MPRNQPPPPTRQPAPMPPALQPQPMPDDLGADFLEYLDTLSPEEADRLLGLGSFGEREALLQDDLTRAQALQQPRGGHYGTAGGAALGALGDIVGAVGGSLQADMIRGKQGALLNDLDARRQLLLEAARRQRGMQGQVPGSAGAADIEPSRLFRLG